MLLPVIDVPGRGIQIMARTGVEGNVPGKTTNALCQVLVIIAW